MKKILSIFIGLCILVSLCSVSVFAEADWDNLSDFIFMDFNGEKVEEQLGMCDSLVVYERELNNYFSFKAGDTITVKNNAPSDNYLMYINISPIVKLEDGSYLGTNFATENFVGLFAFTNENKLAPCDARRPFQEQNYYKILHKGDSYSFNLSLDLFREWSKEYANYLSSEEVLYLVSVEVGYSEMEANLDSYDYLNDLCENQHGLFWTLKLVDEETLIETPTNKTGFNDVKETDYYYDAVKWAVDKGITKGTSETEFSPNKTCTHAEILTFLWRASGEEVISTSLDKFKGLQNLGISENDYFVNAYKWAYDNGVIGGTITTVSNDPTARETETTIEVPIYKPTEFCSRMNTVNYLFNTVGRDVIELDTWSAKDLIDVSGHDMAIVAWAIDNGITKGTSETTFSPNDTCTRGQIVTFLYRAFANR